MSFPYHAVPDGSTALPHHYTLAVLLSLVPILTVWDWYPRRDPWLALLAALVGLFSFVAVWPRYPSVGATLALAACALLLLAPLRPTWWEHWPRGRQTIVVVLALVAADDVLQHAFGIVTPIDWAWKHGGRAAVTGTL
ncbi:hypothetical protein [Halomicrobium urmianum]|uniref:hypothetical protein n=1 Tax=Halomicrobium urmianum TaxID=1586233 RepID=UPI001CDA2AA7|nr:hypothetical protein [Halomicrobium urmianum]